MEYNLLALLVTRRAEVLRKVTTKVHHMYAKHQVNNMLNTRNGLLLIAVLDLLINSEVLI
jgi:hypothetical protein